MKRAIRIWQTASSRLLISTSDLELFSPASSSPPHFKIALPVSIRLVNSAFRVSLLPLYCESFGWGVHGIMSRELTQAFQRPCLLINIVHVRELCFRFAFRVIYHQAMRLGKKRHRALPLPVKVGLSLPKELVIGDYRGLDSLQWSEKKTLNTHPPSIPCWGS